MLPGYPVVLLGRRVERTDMGTLTGCWGELASHNDTFYTGSAQVAVPLSRLYHRVDDSLAPATQSFGWQLHRDEIKLTRLMTLNENWLSP